MVLSENRQQICTDMLDIVGAIGKGQQPLQEDINKAALCLNLAISDLRNEGFQMFQVTQNQTTLVTSDLVSGYRCTRSHTSSSDTEPGVGSQWQSFWFRDSSIVGSAWVSGVPYHSIGDLTLSSDVQEIIRFNIKINDNDWPCEIVDFDKYFEIPLKQQTGQPIQVYVDYQSTSPILYFFYQPDKEYFISYLTVNKIPSLDSPDQVPVYQENWINALTYRAAQYLSDRMRIPLNERGYIRNQADTLMELARRSEYNYKTDIISQGAFRPT